MRVRYRVEEVEERANVSKPGLERRYPDCGGPVCIADDLPGHDVEVQLRAPASEAPGFSTPVNLDITYPRSA